MKKIFLCAGAVFCSFFLTVNSSFAQGTAFTYQGRLNNGASPANGSYDLTFSLFNAGTGGSQMGGTLTNTATAVSNGLFTTTLNFGAGVFTGTNLWLAIGVRTNDGGAFNALLPLQELTPTPYAIFANTASNVSGTVPAGQLSGTVSLAQLPGAVVTNNNAASVNGTFTGNGAGLTNVNATALNGLGATNFWQLAGNNVSAGQFLGSTNNQPVELHVNGLRALRLEPGGVSASLNNGIPNGAPNVIGGSPVNFISPGVVGAVIAGGGTTNYAGNSSTNSIGTYSDFSTIGGGAGNTIQTNSSFSFIGDGARNTIQASSQGGVIVGGDINVIHTNSSYSAIIGGQSNTASGNYSTVDGGQNNLANGTWTTINGGDNNTNTGNASTIGGGQNNTIINGYMPTVGGGYGNTASADYATVGGGYGNIASGDGAFIGGGGVDGNQDVAANVASGPSSAIGGGLGNTASGYGAFIGGGGYDDNDDVAGNNASGGASVIGGGLGNQAKGDYDTVGGGDNNNNSGNAGTIAGGQNNTAGSYFQPTVGGGYDNTAGGNYATVAGGFGNVASGSAAFIGAGGTAGSGNTVANVASGAVSVIGGGLGNQAANIYATIGGGDYNTNSGNGGTIAGGQNNTAGNYFQPTVGGGYGNTASAPYATVGGGFGNQASGVGAFVGGGGDDEYADEFGNIASGGASVIGGGLGNQATANYATVAGGEFNSAGGVNSFAAGFNAQALYEGDFVWSDSSANAFSSTAANQFLIRAAGGVGINNNNPGAALDIAWSGGLGSPQLRLDQQANDYSRLRFAPYNYTPWDIAVKTSMNFYVNGGPNGGNIMVLTTNGNLSVAGTVTANGVLLTSDRNAKEDFQPLDARAVLAKVAALPVTQWNYKTDSRAVQHIGPMAQDFQAAFGLDGKDDRHISVVDEGGVALAAIQGLNQKLEDQGKAKDAEIQNLKQQNDSLAERMNELEATVKQLAPPK